MPKINAHSEAVMAAQVATWLESQHWEVFQEVARGARADLVGRQSGRTWVIEAKLSLSLALLEQAVDWLKDSHFVSVAIPQIAQQRKGSQLFYKICREKGIGIIVVERGNVIRTVASPKLNRSAHRNPRAISNFLHEAQKTMAPAGGKGGGYWTPFAQTCSELDRIVADRPGITMKEAMLTLKHHYSHDQSAKSNLMDLIQKGVLKNTQCRYEGKAFHLYPAGPLPPMPKELVQQLLP